MRIEVLLKNHFEYWHDYEIIRKPIRVPQTKQKIVSMVSMESLLDGQFHSSVCKRQDCNGKIQMAIWCVYSTFR